MDAVRSTRATWCVASATSRGPSSSRGSSASASRTPTHAWRMQVAFHSSMAPHTHSMEAAWLSSCSTSAHCHLHAQTRLALYHYVHCHKATATSGPADVCFHAQTLKLKIRHAA